MIIPQKAISPASAAKILFLGKEVFQDQDQVLCCQVSLKDYSTWDYFSHLILFALGNYFYFIKKKSETIRKKFQISVFCY